MYLKLICVGRGRLHKGSRGLLSIELFVGYFPNLLGHI